MAKSGGKGKGSGQAARQRQQQEAAARRRGTSAAAGPGRPATAPPAPEPAAQAALPQGKPRDAEQRERWFLDVSAVRIQEWLARTPDLKFRRGASVLLSEATAADEWAARLPAGTQWNDEAGSVDGVVSLELAADTGERDSGEAAARQVAAVLREKMPHIHIQAIAGRGATYADAYAGMARARRDGDLLLDLPPAPPEVIEAKPCDQCRSAAAVHERVEIIKNKAPSDRDPDLCGECHERFQAAGGTKGDELRRSPAPEVLMMKALGTAGMRVAGFSDDFARMAAAARTRRDDAATQLALIYADGNRVGDSLRAAAEHASGKAGKKGGASARIDKSQLVRLIDEATAGALADAVLDRFRDWKRPPVLANLAGGDDLLISVPAVDAWMFTRVLLASFGRRTAQAARGWPTDIRVPTMSAGLVFAHKTHPFSDLVRVVAGELGKAKAATSGQQAAVSFLDLTADGGQPPQARVPLSLGYLDGHAADFERIERIPPSRRQALLALLRQDAADDAIRRLTDLDGNQPLWDVIMGRPGAAAGETRQKLAADATALAEFRLLLDIARHWRTLPREKPEAREGRQGT